MYTWTEDCTGVHLLNPDHCRPHNRPAAVIDGGYSIRAENAERNSGFWATPATKGNMLIHK